MKFMTPFTVVIPFMTVEGIRDYRQLRFEQGPSGEYWMDRRLIRRAIKKVMQPLGIVITNDYCNHLIQSGKWAFRGKIIGSADNHEPTDTSESGSIKEAT